MTTRHFIAKLDEIDETFKTEFRAYAFSDYDEFLTGYMVQSDGSVIISTHEVSCPLADYAQTLIGCGEWVEFNPNYDDLLTPEEEMMLTVLKCEKEGVRNIDSLPRGSNPFTVDPNLRPNYLMDHFYAGLARRMNIEASHE
jgi:hypothetical protein